VGMDDHSTHKTPGAAIPTDRTPGPATPTDHTVAAATSPDIMSWRECRLRQAGFDPARASELAREERIDFHSLLELIDRGCPPDLAARIVAPLDGEGGSSR
jgi:hypothetical protein